MTEFENGIYYALQNLEIRYFEDMTFEEESSTSRYFNTRNVPLHLGIAGERVKVTDEVDLGGYAPEQRMFVFNPEIFDSGKIDQRVLLHELIHAEEHSIMRNIPELRDVLVLELYKKLRVKYSNIDDYLLARTNADAFVAVHESGGTHSILFALKALDIDNRMGWVAGTTFAYDWLFH